MSPDMPDAQTQPRADDQGALDRERTLLDFAVSRSPAIFYIADLDGERGVTFISSNVEAITGHAPSAFLDDPGFAWRHIHPDDQAGYSRVLDDLPSQGDLVREYRLRSAAGDYLWFRDELRLSLNETS